MKKLIPMAVFILSLPLAYSVYGGETWSYHFDVCDNLKVNITGADEILYSEYIIINDCSNNGTDYYECNCTDGYDFNITFSVSALNNYTLNFNYEYSYVINIGHSSGGHSSSSGNTIIIEVDCGEWTDCQPNSKATRDCSGTIEERNCYYFNATEDIEISPPEEPPVIEPTPTPTPEPINLTEEQEVDVLKFTPLHLVLITMFIGLALFGLIYIGNR